MKKVVILGAGISGLSHGWYLRKKYSNTIDLKILEKTNRVGGWISSYWEDGFLFERGPRGFRPSANTLQLVEELGIQEELVASHSKKRYLWIQNKLVPVSFWLLLRSQLIKAAFKDFTAKPAVVSDETIASFCERHFGKKLAATVIDPLVRGIFCGSSQELSMASCFPSLWNLKRQSKSFLASLLFQKKDKNLPSLFSFKNGMETLPKKLGEKLEGDLYLSTQVEEMVVRDNKIFLKTAKETIQADHVISTIPLYALATIWADGPKELQNVCYNTLVCVHFGWEGKKLGKHGYGFLIPTNEKQEIYGMTWDSEIFPNQNPGHTRVCVMMPEVEPHHAIEKGKEYIKRCLQIYEAPQRTSYFCAKKAIPQYSLNHDAFIKTIQAKLPNCVHLSGTWEKGVGINDCIAKSAKMFSIEQT